MVAKRIGVVICRIGAVVLVVEAIRTLGYIVPGMLMSDDFGADSAMFLIMFVVPGFAAIFLWVFADRISGDPESAIRETQTETVSELDIVAIGTLLIGVYVLVYGIISVVSTEFAAMAMPDFGPEQQEFRDQTAARTFGSRASYLAQVILGIFLIAGRSRIAEFVARARRAGTGAA